MHVVLDPRERSCSRSDVQIRVARASVAVFRLANRSDIHKEHAVNNPGAWLMCMPGPDRADLFGSAITNGEHEIQRACAWLREFLPALAAKPLRRHLVLAARFDS